MRIHLGGSSRKSFLTSRGALDSAVKGASASAASELSAHLFFAADVLASKTSLRRAFADVSRDASSKKALVADLFGSKISPVASELLSTIASLRWSAAGDLVTVIEQLAVEAQGSAANIDGELDRLESELFSVSRLIADNFELRKALVGHGSVEAKGALISEVLSKSAAGSTVKLAMALVTSLRGRSIEAAFADYLFALANRRNRLIALVRVATEITEAQKTRLAAAIEKQVGQPISINIQIDPSIIGGVSVKFADDLVDGSISNRLAGAGRALVSQN